MNSRIKYVVITPVRDEAMYVERTIVSMMSQTILPSQWIIVDDGSTDGTGEILDRHAANAGWITVIHKKNRGFRANGGGVMEAFYTGYAAVTEKDWDFIVKLDGDLSFEPDYFQTCFGIFEDETHLGIGGGTIYRLENGRPLVDSAGDPPFHVRGATKIYRRACWDRISPLAMAPGWDTIDEVKANFHGWSTRTFASPGLIQHKPTGGADGNWRNAFKNGRAAYLTGYHPLFMLAKCLRRAFRRWPFMVESTALLTGFTTGYLKGLAPMADPEVIDYLRRQQVRRLFMQPSIYA